MSNWLPIMVFVQVALAVSWVTIVYIQGPARLQ